MSEKQKWCPMVGGTIHGFDPEWYNRDTRRWEKVWVSFAIDPKAPRLPYPLAHGGILREVGLFGESQAHALAHWFAANKEATGRGSVDVRVIQYTVNYEIKAKQVGEEKEAGR